MSGSPWGGSEELWSQAALRLLEAGHEVQASVFCWPETPAPIRKLREKGLRIDERKRLEPSFYRRIALRVLGAFSKKQVLDSDWQKILAFRPDLLCVSDGGISGCMKWINLCQSAGIPYVKISQANNENWWPDDEAASPIYQAHAGACKSYFVSKGNLSLFETQVGACLTNAEIVRNPFNVSWTATPAWPSQSRGFKLACVARLAIAAKGQDILFRVLAQEKWRKRALQVTLFGVGPNASVLQRLADRYELSESICFAGQTSDVEQIWSGHHALILPSRFEGLPLAVVEAMLCGRPVVAALPGN